MVEIGCLLHMLDNIAVTGAACEASGAEAGWNAAVRHTAKVVGPTAANYLEQMVKHNPYTEEAKMLMDLAATPPESSHKP